MSTGNSNFDWFYIGQFGQLGPLSEEQMIELIRDEVVKPETYVWKAGMADWVRAQSIPQFVGTFPSGSGHVPPPQPLIQQPTPAPSPTIPSWTQTPQPPQPMMHHVPHALVPYSDKSRIAAGVLNLFLPGVGRMYLGFVTVGIIQFLTSFCFGIGALWSIIDGILFLTRQNNTDVRGRVLKD
ncbi:MAG: DUF4339 domain-containing protein [Armatimonadetes bacterium]|nr:DUF4339 domain-containing protein [Armatimonadota bacterium]